MKIAIISLDQAWEDKQSNKEKCSYYVDLAINKSCDLIIFPEMTLTGFTMDANTLAEDADNSETIRYFKKEAKKGINIIHGVAIRQGEKAVNTLVAISRNGDLLTEYQKIHPFSFSKENDYYSAGEKLGIGTIDKVNFGYTICYDLRFPEIFQALSKTVSVVVNIANWPDKRVNHWQVLLAARAIENQVYMIGVNRTGDDGNGLSYSKSSAIYDPSGDSVTAIFSQDDLDVYDINPDLSYETQASFPVKQDRKVNFYKSII